MVSLITPKKAQNNVAQNIRALRLEKGFTQKALSERSGVSFASVKKFEQTGIISLESFFKLAMALGCLEKLVEATQPMENEFSSIDEVLNKKEEKKPQRGWRK